MSPALPIKTDITTYKLINNDNITQKIISTSSQSQVLYECLLNDFSCIYQGGHINFSPLINKKKRYHDFKTIISFCS